MRGLISRHPHAVALWLYALIAVAFFGLPLLDDFDGQIVGANEIEPSVFVWFLEWWPHAVLNGLNPFVPEIVYAPEGYNITWAASIPGLSLLMAPVTLAAGPVAAYNVLLVAAPALAAWTAFLLCHRVTGAFLPSLVGGYIFGFSAYVLYTLAGVAHLAFVALVPLCAYLVVRRAEGSMESRRFVVCLALCIAAQFLVSPEVFALTVLWGVAAAVTAWFAWRDLRPRLAGLAREGIASCAGAAVLVSPYLYFMLFRPHQRPDYAKPEVYSSDLLSFVIPTHFQRVGRGWFLDTAQTFGGGGGPGGAGVAYLGVVLLAILVAFAIERRRTGSGRLLTILMAMTMIASLGPGLIVRGERLIAMPGRVLAELPLLEYAIPSHFPIYTALAASIAVSMWLAASRSRGRWVLAGAAMLLLLPNLGTNLQGGPGYWQAPASTPAFFSDARRQGLLKPSDNVLAFPLAGAANRWHAVSGMDFRLASGYVSGVPLDLVPLYDELYLAGQSSSQVRQRRALSAFVRERRVTAIVVDAGVGPGWRATFDSLGVRPIETGGVLFYRVAPARG